MEHTQVTTATTANDPITARGSLILGLGFATATVMWAIGYVAFMQPGLVLG